MTASTGGANANTPLHLTVYQSNPAMAELLIDSGADMNIGDGDGDTALHLSVGGMTKDPQVRQQPSISESFALVCKSR